MSIEKQELNQIDCYIGNRILGLRLAKGLSRQQLASNIGVTHQQLQKYEKGINRISAGRLVLIAQALNKPVSYFFDGVNGDDEIVSSQHQRMCIEVSRNFMKISQPEHQIAINQLIRSLIKDNNAEFVA